MGERKRIKLAKLVKLFIIDKRLGSMSMRERVSNHYVNF